MALKSREDSKKKAGVEKNVFYMGVASFFNDLSSEMILSLLPLFLTNVLGVGQAIIGLIEGIAESTSSILKLLSGWVSDRFDTRKPLIVAGYSISNLAKPLLFIANSWLFVLIIKFTDRVGKGVRTSARDSLIAASSNEGKNGRSFGFHRMMDTLGAVAGAGAAFVMLYIFSMSFQTIFLFTVIPGVLAVLTILLFVKDRKVKNQDKSNVKFSLKPFSSRFKKFIVVSTLFTLGNFSYAFLLIRAQDIGVALLLVPLLYFFYNVVYAIVSLPVGDLSDKIGKRKVLTMGFLLFSIVSLGFGFTDNIAIVVFLFGLYGIFQAIYEVSSRAFIPEMVEPSQRGTAYGVFHTSVGLAAFPASFIMGSLWQFVSVEVAFGFGASLSLISAVLLLTWVKK